MRLAAASPAAAARAPVAAVPGARGRNWWVRGPAPHRHADLAAKPALPRSATCMLPRPAAPARRAWPAIRSRHRPCPRVPRLLRRGYGAARPVRVHRLSQPDRVPASRRRDRPTAKASQPSMAARRTAGRLPDEVPTAESGWHPRPPPAQAWRPALPMVPTCVRRRCSARCARVPAVCPARRRPPGRMDRLSASVSLRAHRGIGCQRRIAAAAWQAKYAGSGATQRLAKRAASGKHTTGERRRNGAAGASRVAVWPCRP